MLTARYEVLSFLAAALVGGLLLRNVFLAERPPALNIEGFTEAQHLQITPESDLQVPVMQDTSGLSPGNFSGEDFVWFPASREGETIAFQLNAIEPGSYTLELHLAPSGDFGIFAVSLNGQILAEQIDLHPSAFRYREPFVFSEVTLQRDNTLSFTVVGHNAATSAPHYQFGFDGIALRRGAAQ
jgi:hypothetical protein